jgi:outer membrane protein assembly factor BamE (lipoprotein component of BamABCDE complex)
VEPDQQVTHVLAASILAVSTLVAGCLPIPIAPMSSSEITEDSLRAIQPMTSTRADVLLALGDPTIRGQEDFADSYFVYDWGRFHGGMVFVLVGYTSMLPAAGVGSGSCNSVAIRFTPDGHVERIGRFSGKAETSGGLVIDTKEPSQPDGSCDDAAVRQAIKAWLEEGTTTGD